MFELRCPCASFEHAHDFVEAISAAIEQQAAHGDAASSAFEGVSEDGQARITEIGQDHPRAKQTRRMQRCLLLSCQAPEMESEKTPAAEEPPEAEPPENDS